MTYTWSISSLAKLGTDLGFFESFLFIRKITD